MVTFIAVVHILVAVLLIGLVLIQDSKGGGALGIGGGAGSNSLLGATGAQTLAARMTRWCAVAFAATCIILTIKMTGGSKSVIDAAPVLPVTPRAGEGVTPETIPASNAPAAGGAAVPTSSEAPAAAAPATK